LQPWSTFSGASIGAAAGGFVVRYLFGSLFEELFARGYLLRTLAEVCRGSGLRREPAVVLAAALTAVLFGVAHLANPDASARSALNLTLLGLVFALPMVATSHLGLSVGLHAGWNIMQNTVLGLPNSGKASLVALVRTDVVGPVAWTGGPFGLEGGWATTVLLFVVLGIGGAWLSRDPATRIAARLADAPTPRRAA
jgi:membrane protease YdiL (CAAX protease family)